MFKIITDSSANLPSEIIKKYKIEVISFHYIMNGREYSAYTGDQTEVSLKRFYAMMRKGADVTTSMINISEYTDCFEPHLANGEDILYIGMSSGISGAMHSADLSAIELREKYHHRTIETIDTKAASLGEGLAVLYAAKLKESGSSLIKTTMKTKKYVATMCQFFTVGSLNYLKKGGRISSTVKLIGSLLNIRPILSGNDEGKIILSGKARGKNNAFEILINKYTELHLNASDTIGIAGADCEESIEFIKNALLNAGHTGEIITACYEPVTGSHVGPGTVALFFPGIHR